MRKRAIAGALALVAGCSQTAGARAPITELPVSDAYSAREIRDYASALFEVLTLRRIADLRWRSASRAERPFLRRQASAAISAILSRHGFSSDGFNRMSAAVERQPALRREVRQLVMREGLGFH